MSTVLTAFELDIVLLDVHSIVPVKTITATDRKSATYHRIAVSIEHVGLVEPLVVHATTEGKYTLLDGHARLDILIASGATSVPCLLSRDDEAYTYNKKVSQIPPIARHYMILRALEHVSEERIAAALDVNISVIREKRNLLNGICPEAVEVLREQRVSSDAFAALRRMRPVRQIEAARCMLSAHRFSGRFARALLDGTRSDLLVNAPPLRLKNVAAEDRSMMQQETDEMLRHIHETQESYGRDVLSLTTVCRYIERLLANTRVRRYLSKHHEESLGALTQVVSEVAADKQRRPPSKPTAHAKKVAAG